MLQCDVFEVSENKGFVFIIIVLVQVIAWFVVIFGILNTTSDILKLLYVIS